MTYELHNADCLEWTRQQKPKSVNLTIGSPPYEAARTYGVGFKLRGQPWVDWAVERFVDQVRITDGLVCWVIEGQTRDFRWSATPALFMADLHCAGVHLRKPPIFHRIGIPGSGGPDWLRNDYEFVVCGSSGEKLLWSDNTAMGHPPKWAPGGAMSHRLTNGTKRNQWGGSSEGVTDSVTHVRNKHGERQPRGRPSHRIVTKQKDGMHGGQENTFYSEPKLANPGNIIQEWYSADEVAALLAEASNVTHHLVGGGVMGDDLAHENEAPFPETLAEFFVRSFCPPGGLVYDPFTGSGTTADVCMQWNRNFVGTDIRESQIELTRRRLKEVQPNLFAG